MTKAEQETVIRYDQRERILHLRTAYAPDARKWATLGYPVEVCERAADGKPRGWRAQAPTKALRLRRIVDGNVSCRPRGRSIALRSCKLTASEHRSNNSEGSDHPQAA